MGVFLFDNKQILMASRDTIESTQDWELGGQISASVIIEYDKEIEANASYFGFKEENNFLLFKIRNITKSNNQLALSGIHIFFDDLKGAVVRDIRNQNTTASLVVGKILNGTGWSVGANLSTITASKNYYYQSALECFYDAVSTWNFEFIPQIQFSNGKIVSKKLNIYNEISKDYGKWYEYGDKLVDIVAESNVDELYTAFIGRGKGLETEDGGYSRKVTFKDIAYKNKPVGVDYIEIKEATKAYGYPDGSPRIGVVEFSEIEDPQELAEATYQFAIENARPRLQLKATTLDGESVELGETVAIIRSDMNIRYKARVYKIHKVNGKVATYEFGDKIIASQGSRLKSEAYEKRRRDEMIDSYIDSLRDEINSSYFNDAAYNYDLKIGNEYGLPAGYYSFDRLINDNPTKVIYMGAGKLLVANSKNADGSWKWGTMATGNGVVAESIVGTLGEYANINAKQINVNNDFGNTALGRKVVVQGKLYNNVKITPEKGVQVLDANSRERVQIGNIASGRYGLKLTDATGNRTVLDDMGILQSWQDSQTDNTDRGYPLELHIFIPRETASIYKADLRIYTSDFRAYQRGNEYQRSEYSTSDDGGGDYASDSTDDGGGYRDAVTSGAAEVTFDGRGVHNHSIPRGTQLVKRNGGWVDWMPSGDHIHNVSVYIPGHSHRFSIRIPSHNHRFEIPGHTHEPIFGIITSYNRSDYTISINGTDRTSSLLGRSSFTGTVEGVNIAPYLTIGAWNIISIASTALGRVSASLFIQAFLKYGG